MSFDLVIRNGVVVDGSGFGSYRADVGIVGDRIVEIGRIRERGVQEIDAEGCVVTPGFIDGHTHFDAQVFWDRVGVNSCWHGVTTAVMGNCGFTLAPVHSDAREMVVRNLERAEDIDPAALAQGIDWSWESYGSYLDAVDRLPKGIHYASNIGHSALRTYVMGERAFTDEATEDDLVAMERVLAEALHAGALGFTTSRSKHHETSDDRPVASRLAAWSEVERLVQVMADVGVGMLEGGTEDMMTDDPDERALAEERILDLAVRSGVPVTCGLLATEDGGPRMLSLLDRVADAGGRMIGQSHCRGINVLLSFKTRLPFDRLPEWQHVRSLPLEGQRQALSDPATRAILEDAAMNGDYSAWRGIGALPRPPQWDRLLVLDRGLPPQPTVAEVAAARGVSPAAAMIDLALESDFEVMFVQPSLYPQSDEVLRDVLRHPRTVMTFSDSGAHLGQICDSSIQTHLLGHWVRQRQEFTLEEAVRMLTLAPATAWGFSDRGLIREGLLADIVVFDPDTVGPAVPQLVPDLPGGGLRISQRADGFRATVVAGQVTIADGNPTGATPGRLVRNRLAR